MNGIYFDTAFDMEENKENGENSWGNQNKKLLCSVTYINMKMAQSENRVVDCVVPFNPETNIWQHPKHKSDHLINFYFEITKAKNNECLQFETA